jgi:hypothetical protein
VILAEHKVELSKVDLEQQRALEKYGLQDDGSMGWQLLPWDTPVYAEAGRMILVRYAGVKDLHKWDAYAPHITV